LVIRTFLFQPFNIPSGSMKATLLVGDYLFVSKYSYGYSHYSIPLSPPLFSGRIFGSEPSRGDIVVSTETARRMSREFGWMPRQEVAYYVIHGLLHLTGYDDRTVADRRAMRARERAVMRAIGMPAPPRTRSRRSRS
jgi:rRNA maturation RNase YbeY